MTEENSLWKGSPSQWLNLGTFTVGLLLMAGIIAVGMYKSIPAVYVALLLPMAWMLWKYLVVRTQTFELTSERLRYTRGVINQTVDEIELYRVKDSVLVRKWWMRLTGLANIELVTSDRTLPDLAIKGISGGTAMRELLRKQVEIQRDKKRVRETDFDEATVGDGVSGSFT